MIILSLNSIASDEINAEKNCESEYIELCQAYSGLPATRACNEAMIAELSTQCKQLLESNARLEAFSSFGAFSKALPADEKIGSVMVRD